MDYVTDSDKPTVSRHSSIAQYKDFFGVLHNGMFCPMVFDYLDGIVCGEVHSHPIMVSFGEWIGQHFPVKRCYYTDRVAMMAHDEGEGLHLLPEQFGRGDCWHNSFYEEYHNEDVLMAGDDGTLVGFEHTRELLVGLDYVLAEDTLESAD